MFDCKFDTCIFVKFMIVISKGFYCFMYYFQRLRDTNFSSFHGECRDDNCELKICYTKNINRWTSESRNLFLNDLIDKSEVPSRYTVAKLGKRNACFVNVNIITK